MRYGHPLIEEALREIHREGIREVVAIPMAPFRSRASTGAYMEEVSRSQRDLENEVNVLFIEGWHDHPLFVDAVRER